MKKIITIAILIIVSTAVQLISSLPWWSFLVFIFILGAVLPLKKWKVSSFLSGFIAGLSVWLLSTLYFEAVYKDEIIDKISNLFDVHYILLLIIIGLIGGLITGLAFYSGFLLRRGKEVLRLELPEK